MQYNCKKCWHSSKVTIFYSGLCIENSIPFINIVAPTIVHIIMGKFILFTSTLRLLQKKAIRILLNTDYRAHSRKLFFKLKLLKLDDIMTFQLGTFIYKLKNNKLPSMIPHILCSSLMKIFIVITLQIKKVT